MGTRGLLGHILNARKRGSYNHFDSYPDGLGIRIVKFLVSLSRDQIEQMKANLATIEWVDEEKDKPDEEAKKRYVTQGFTDLDVSTRDTNDWYCLLRDVQGAASLFHILSGDLKHLINSTDFEDDTLFCEAVYYINWDAEELSVRWKKMVETKKLDELTEEWMHSLQHKDSEQGKR